ncbi:MAG: DegT/DnrJ/EryC1/StrS family aminotransferase [Gammaproteobacteria bacterium]|nr:DegT/DnrJ/EryC1/StrS family aminotransferase [Gammaproteobacteria bacterium]
MKFIDLQTPLHHMEDQMMARIKRVLAHGSFVMGPEIVELETQLAQFVGVQHALTASSGTDALLIALMALEVGPGDEVITTPFSFFASAEVILLLGATPIFVDIDPKTYNLDAQLLEAAITPKTKAIMPVSLYGQCADYDAINAIASRHQIPVIEDAAQSFGATYRGKKSCALTTIACTSFFPSKPLGCYGDGGACFTSDPVLAERMQQIRNHGQSERYVHTRLGLNGRMDTLQAAVLLEKMTLFPVEIAMRDKIAKRYAEQLPKEVIKPYIAPYNTSVFAQYTIQVTDRERVRQALQQHGIPTAVHYQIGLHQQPIVQAASSHPVSYPHTEAAAERVMSLPMHPYLTTQDQDKICELITVVLSDVAVAC